MGWINEKIVRKWSLCMINAESGGLDSKSETEITCSQAGNNNDCSGRSKQETFSIREDHQPRVENDLHIAKEKVTFRFSIQEKSEDR